ncbi:MAG: hypothetical protein J2P21_27015, partial [Chloracidobacterium sp.]|nr:hypothetical protein [Chloracidobacterium sp.]
EHWGPFEIDLNRTVIRLYDLRPQRVRIDSTTASAFVTPDGPMECSRLVIAKIIAPICHN